MFDVIICPGADEYIFKMQLIRDHEVIGEVFIVQHPDDRKGAEVHMEILPDWRKRWLSRQFKERILSSLLGEGKKQAIKLFYSTALTPVSPRLLEFFGFIEYNRKQAKTHYYLEVM